MSLAEGAWYVTSNSAGTDLVFKEALNMTDRAKSCLQGKKKKPYIKCRWTAARNKTPNITPCICNQLTCHPISLSMHLHHNIRMCSEHTCVAHRWNPGSGSEHTHVSQQWNPGTGPERTNMWTVASYYGTVKQVLNIPICHTEGILDQALNVRESWRWNSGTGSEHMRVTEMEFWNSLWTLPNVKETEFWNSLWMYPDVTNRFLEQALNVPMCHIWNSGRGSERTHVSQMEFWYRLWMHSVRDRILDQALNVPMCHRWNCGIGFDCIHLSWR